MIDFIRTRIRLISCLLILIAIVLSFTTNIVPGAKDYADTILSVIRDKSTSLVNRFISGRSLGDGKNSKNRNAKGVSGSKVITGVGLVKVKDRRQRPIEGASVIFSPVLSPSKIQKATSDKSGIAKQSLPTGKYLVAVAHKRFSPQNLGVFTIDSNGSGFSVNCTLDAGFELKGLVINEEGKPIPNVIIRGKKQWMEQFSEGAGVFLDDSSYLPARTVESGKFTLEAVSVGDNIIEVSKYGYSTVNLKVNIPANTTPADLKVVLKRPAFISGKVINEDLQEVKGVRIVAKVFKPYTGSSEELPKEKFSAVTDETGSFKLTKLYEGGSYDIEIDHPQFAVGYFNSVTANSTNLIWTIQRGGAISGTVRYVDRPTTAAQVLISATSVVNGTTITRVANSSTVGEFSFSKLPYGAYDFSVNDKGIVNEPIKKLVSQKDKPIKNALIEVYVASKMSGKVYDVVSDDAIDDAEVTVNVTYGFSRVRSRKFTVFTNMGGVFELNKLPGGNLTVSAKAKDYLNFTSNASDPRLALQPGKTLSDYEIGLSQGGTVSGTVVDPDDRPVSGVDVQLFIASGSFNSANLNKLKTTTDGGGFFEIRGIPIGQQLSLYASGIKTGFAKKRSDLIELYPKVPNATTKITLTAGGLITGTVTNVNKSPISNAKIVYESREFPGDPSPSRFVVNTDNNGVYIVDKCTPGQLRISADHRDYVAQTKTSSVGESKLVKVNFVLKQSMGISGFVSDYKGKYIADANVRAIPLSGATGSSSDRTNKKGEFNIRGISPGNFRLEASFNRATPDGAQSYTFIVPKVPSNISAIPIDCDLAPSLSTKVLDEHGSGVDNFSFLFKNKDNTNPEQFFRLRVSRNVKQNGGLLRILDVPRGLYQLEIDAPGYEKYIDDSVAIGADGRNLLKSIRLKSSSQIKGRLVNSLNNKPINGALVRVLDLSKPSVVTVNRLELRDYDRADIIEYLDSMYDDNIDLDPDPWKRLVARVRGNVVLRKSSNFLGEFNINGIGYGSYTIEIEHPDFLTKSISNIKVSKSRTKDLGDVILDPGGTIRGNVSDDDGSGISNAAVSIDGEKAGRNRARTDIGGNYKLRGIGFGNWLISVKGTLNGRMVYDAKNVQSRPNITSTANFVLNTKANITGNISFRNGYASSGNVRLYVPDGKMSFVDDIVYSGAIKTSAYSITGIPTGKYLSLWDGRAPSGNFVGWQWVELGKGTNNIGMQGGSATISGQLISAGGNSIAGMKVKLIPEFTDSKLTAAMSKIIERTVAVNSTTGKFSFVYLKSGAWRVWVSYDGINFSPVDLLNLNDGQVIQGYKLSVP